jgi:hypothetical protein
MSRIVGEGLFPKDVLEHLGDGHSGAPYQDVSPERFSRLEKELVRGKGEIVSLLPVPGMPQDLFMLGSPSVSTTCQLYLSRLTGFTLNSA